ncbi:MAG TPA: AAA family ATPase, partial [Bacteroidales bacterium]|nr:AAA family ATPase [Bacteroidales bacterium]
MIKLIKVKIKKYKSFTLEQEVAIDERITTVVGKNESGKTAFLEAIAKVNYFEKDENFTLNPIGDFPRNELSRFKVNHEDVEAVNG